MSDNEKKSGSLLRGKWGKLFSPKPPHTLSKPLARALTEVAGVHESRLADVEASIWSGKGLKDISQYRTPKPDSVVLGRFAALPDHIARAVSQQSLEDELAIPHLGPESFCTYAERTVGDETAPAGAFKAKAEKPYHLADALVNLDEADTKIVLDRKFDVTEPVAVDGALFIKTPEWTAADEQTAQTFFNFILNSVALGQQNDVIVRDTTEKTLVERALRQRYDAMNPSRGITFPILTNGQVEREGYFYNLLISERSRVAETETQGYSDPLNGVMRLQALAPSAHDPASLHRAFGKEFKVMSPATAALSRKL